MSFSAHIGVPEGSVRQENVHPEIQLAEVSAAPQSVQPGPARELP